MRSYSNFTVFGGHNFNLRLLSLSLVFLFLTLIPANRAEAACTVPNSITNGQVADATKVMGNFNALKDCVDSVVSPTGTPVAGNLSIFSSPNTITSGNLTGDCTTAGTLSVTCTKANGTSFGAFATGTNAGQLTGTISPSRFNNGVDADSTHFLRGDGVWATPPGGTGGGGTQMPAVRASNIQSSNGTSWTVTWPTGTVAGDVVFVFAEQGWGFVNPTGWTILDNQGGSNAAGMVAAKVMSAADITAGSVTITANGSFNAVIAAVTINGSTMSGLRPPAVYVRSSSGPAAGGTVSLSSATPTTTDLVLAFVGIRATSNLTLSSGYTSLSSINATSASGIVGKFTGSVELLGINGAATTSAAGSGYYSAVVIIR